jgi:uncharacterized membrane protein
MSGTAAPLPWFVAPVLLLTGAVVIGLAIPLVLRRVKPNHVYGFRVPATLADEHVWFEMNARAGRHLIVIGITYIALLASMLVTTNGNPSGILLLAPMGFLVSALIIDALMLTTAANRMLAQRRGPK